MNLNETLTQIEKDFGFGVHELQSYAAEDSLTGWDNNNGDFPVGSIWGVEGQIMYAILRAIGATTAVELGTHAGCSALHIIGALNMHTPNPELTCVDLGLANFDNEHRFIQGVAGITLLKQDAIKFVQQAKSNSIEFLFEDLTHEPHIVAGVWKEAARILKPGGFIVSHDALHWACGPDVRNGIGQSGLEYKAYLTSPSDCGLAIWRKPEKLNLNVQVEKEEIEALKDGDEVVIEHNGDSKIIDIEEVEEKPKRKPRRKKKKPEPVAV